MIKRIGTANQKAAWAIYKQNKGALIGTAVLSVIMLMALIGPLLAPYDPAHQFNNKVLVPPIWSSAGDFNYFFGTDDLGRDLLSRLLHGARLSLQLTITVVLIAAISGIVIGAASAFLSPALRSLLMRIMDLLLSFPSLLLAIAIVAIIGPGLPNAIYAVIIVLIPQFVRITQSAISDELNKDYVMAARLDGAKRFRLLTHHVWPNIVPALIVQLTFSFSTALLDIAALGFLGLGAQPPMAEWGTMLSESRAFIQFAPWTMTLPGLAIFLTVLSINLVGDGVRDALDPRLNR
ncbi:ABC transporter permease subunit [Kangiella sediminilitoris]|uniref:Peptide ABC transporter n=1 Tax=Kangiella sediminilitoris TaxID=1144748 RepID=A0A1B3B995_9GAMM|nr:ABC transporter permease subunit [Kangiella sediminilitoris]AOE49350.1 peptide ABC transporter [Kangiella sediminilitoris]